MLLFLLGSGYENEGELTDDDRSKLDEIYNIVISATAGIGSRQESGADMQATIVRIINFVTGVYWYAYMVNGLEDARQYIWVLGDTDHCSTCLGQAGKGAMPKSHWIEMAMSGIYPNSPDLECTGLHCQCGIEEA